MPKTSVEFAIPEPTRDENNNPIWKIPMEVTIRRQDNTMSLTVHAGTLANDDVHASIAHALGGFVYTCDVTPKKRGKLVEGATMRYALDCLPLLKRIIELDPELRKVEQLPRKKDQRNNAVHSRPTAARSSNRSSRTAR